ncbi:hypothetical protein ELQ35_00195 [Peribacillus cavernae]|uniref:YppF-like protein n=1 Tax=Peribacillus cavernae TaxID=1674310 RepID=A0A433HW42_9BACI|nr:YppF family protein [Peribacillus cavernae]MDQ0217899.1 hypothetical protein [Peribacillus cavernae]RUQ32560.1 hypothetical protein ELQ35_00195 [Peribacillus cavernae]
MTLENLIAQFILTKSQVPKHANVLLDFLKTEYILGKMPIEQYRRLLGELDKRGAEKP